MPPVKPLFGTPLNRVHPLAQGLVGCWLFNEGSGNKAYDSGGNGNHGTLSGFADPATAASGWCAGPHGGALAFDGVNDYITTQLPDMSEFSAYVFLVWKQDSSTNDHIIGSWTAGSKGWGMKAYPAGNIRIFAYGADRSSLDTPITAGIPTFRCITSKNGLLSVYYPGGIKNVAGLTQTNGNNLVVGSVPSVGASAPWSGLLSVVYIHNRALSPSEVAYLNAFPYCMFDQDDDLAMYQNHVPAIMQHHRRLVA